jgi:hypothetical protein
MANFVCLLQFTDQGVRNIKDTIKRADAATAEAKKMGAKITQAFWTMGAYDVILLLERLMTKPQALSPPSSDWWATSRPRPCVPLAGKKLKTFWLRSDNWTS